MAALLNAHGQCHVRCKEWRSIVVIRSRSLILPARAAAAYAKDANHPWGNAVDLSTNVPKRTDKVRRCTRILQQVLIVPIAGDHDPPFRRDAY